MDPALLELFEAGGDDEVAAILRLHDAGAVPAGVRVVAQFGTIATCRLPREAIPEVRRDPSVASLKAARTLAHEAIEDVADEELPVTTGDDDRRRPEHLDVTGRGVVVACLDWGFDFTHADFRHPDGRTRLLGLWDQRQPMPAASPTADTPPNRYGYGRMHSPAAIDAALGTADPFSALGYHPADADPGRTGAHGTHTAGIAVSNGLGGGPVGIAPEAAFAFVHLATWGTSGLSTLGDSVTLLEGVDYVAWVAAHRSWVANLSLGSHGGPHDGRTLVEQGLDAAVRAAPGRAIVHSAGNYYTQRTHAAGRVVPGGREALIVEVSEDDPTGDELEVWYPGEDRLAAIVESPDGSLRQVIELGQLGVPLYVNGQRVGTGYHRGRDPNSSDNHLDVFLYPGAPAGPWRVTLVGIDVADGRFHAWIERDAACASCQARFPAQLADPAYGGLLVTRTTTGTLCNGRRTLAVGAYDAHHPERPIGPFSSSGPTRDGRAKPDLVAPGVAVLSARSAPQGVEAPISTYCRKSGTSMAAPHVTGTVALMFEAAGRPLTMEETRSALLAATEPASTAQGDEDRFGRGYLDIAAAVAAAAALGSRPTGPMQEGTTMTRIDGPTAPAPVPDAGPAEDMGEEPDQAEEPDDAQEPDDAEDIEARAASLDLGLLEEADRPGESSDGHPRRWEGRARVFLADELAESKEGRGDGLAALTEPWVTGVPAPALFDAIQGRGGRDDLRFGGEAFDVVAAPGGTLDRALLPGDLLVERALGEGSLATVSVLVTGHPLPADAVEAEGLTAWGRGEGLFAEVVTTGPVSRSLTDRVARPLTDAFGRLPHNAVVVRHVPGSTIDTGAIAGSAPTMVYEPGAREPLTVAVESRCRPPSEPCHTPPPSVVARAVVPARLLPLPTTDPDTAIREALMSVGLDAAQVGTVAIASLHPFGRMFGADALRELLARLRWEPELIAQHGAGGSNVLAVRLLLHIPGHFRELARRAPDAREAHALESIGWLLMASLAGDLSERKTPSRRRDPAGRWWLPPSPSFVTAFPNPLPLLSRQLHRFVLSMGLVDTTLAFADYAVRQARWEKGMAGRQWALETSGPQPGLAFYPELVTVPMVPATAVATARRAAQKAWAARVQAAGGPFPTGPVTLQALQGAAALRRDAAGPPGLFSVFTVGGGMELVDRFPLRLGGDGRVVRGFQVLGAAKPLFEAVFRAVADLGWNDLVYQTGGAGTFRGKKLPPGGPFAKPTEENTRVPGLAKAVAAAQQLSDHGVGLAVDLNTFENGQPDPQAGGAAAGSAARRMGSMDPRVVALFQAFGFQWGACFCTYDPMHFEVDDAALAAAPRAGRTPATTPTQPEDAPEETQQLEQEKPALAVGVGAGVGLVVERLRQPLPKPTPTVRAERFPPRPTGALSGKEFMKQKGISGPTAPPSNQRWAARENAIVEQLVIGNMPDFLTRWKDIPCAFTANGRTVKGTFWVLPDYLAIGSDENFVHIPMDAISAQRVADAFGCLLPTAKMCHDIYAHCDAQHRLPALTRNYAAREGKEHPEMSTDAYLEHSLAIQDRMRRTNPRISLGELVEGHKKAVVISEQLLHEPTKLAFYGFYDGNGIPMQGCYDFKTMAPTPNCRPGTPTHSHYRTYADYSHGVRLVHPHMEVDGQFREVADVLQDGELHRLLSTEEKPIRSPRVPPARPPGPAGKPPARRAESVDGWTDNWPEDDPLLLARSAIGAAVLPVVERARQGLERELEAMIAEAARLAADGASVLRPEEVRRRLEARAGDAQLAEAFRQGVLAASRPGQLTVQAESVLRAVELQFIHDPGASSLDVLPPARARRFRDRVWHADDYPGGPVGPNESEALAMAAELSAVRPERRPNRDATAVVTAGEFPQVAAALDGLLRAVPGQAGRRLHHQAADSFTAMHAAANAEGVALTILDAHRPAAVAQANAERSGNRAAVAKFSSHTLGLAIDLRLSAGAQRFAEVKTRPMQQVVEMRTSPVHKWMFLRGAAHGWFPYQHEPWHWEYNPPGFREATRRALGLP